jgi:hypothetical protein
MSLRANDLFDDFDSDLFHGGSVGLRYFRY